MKSATCCRSWFQPSAFSSPAGYFGYKLVYPQALRFLIEFSKQFTPMITIEEYSSLFLTIIVGMGVIFEMPILVFFLAIMGMVTAAGLANLRYSILVIFVIAAILTPTTDILNMCIFAAPMVALYMVSIASRGLYIPRSGRSGKERKSS